LNERKGPVITKNMYYSDPQKFDLSKMRGEAVRASLGDQHNEPRNAVIHYHSYEVPCNYPDKPAETEHEFTAAVFGEEK
jgi:hypothetical protein